MINTILSLKDNPRVAFTIGSLEVQWYGLIIVCAMILGLAYVLVECKKVKLTSDEGVELFLWVIPLAVVFARLLYIIPRADEYFPWKTWDDFVHAIAIWEGGITIIGGLVGGVIGGICFTIHHRKKINFGNTADLVVVPLLMGQIIGRLGNFVNQEAFGLPITNKALQTFPFGVYITRPSGYEGEYAQIVKDHMAAGGEGNWFCATFFYEMVWNTIGLIFCRWLWTSNKIKKYPGIMIIFYMFWYCLGRFWLEFLRMDAVPITKVAMGIVAPLALIFGVVYVVARNSQLAYRKVRKLCQDGKLEGALLTEYEVKNYAFAGRIVANDKNTLRVLYTGLPKISRKKGESVENAQEKHEFISIDFENVNYYHVSKDYKRNFKKLVKSAEYTK